MDRTIREKILDTASELFYRQGVHAVGIDTIIAEASVAKSSMYRYFRTKDDLIAAYLQNENEAFWAHWNSIELATPDDPRATLLALLSWIGKKIATPGHRGCPQLNVVAEFPDRAHQARTVATDHKTELRRRLAKLAKRLNVPHPNQAADQLWLVIDGAFANHDLLAEHDPIATLNYAGKLFLEAASRNEPTDSPTTKKRAMPTRKKSIGTTT